VQADLESTIVLALDNDQGIGRFWRLAENPLRVYDALGDIFTAQAAVDVAAIG
jgi:hypothetical protein